MVVTIADRILGCLLGGAIGDALGAPPVEFWSRRQVVETFGPEGITDFHAHGDLLRGSITDDTQLTLASALGLLDAIHSDDHAQPTLHVYRRYLDWLGSQEDPAQRRGPGNTCLSALRSGVMGTVKSRINDSKGCGGVMRVAPIGLVYAPETAFRIAVDAAAITHGHPSGYLSAGALAMIVAYIIDGNTIESAVRRVIQHSMKWPGHGEVAGKLLQAIDLVDVGAKPDQAIPCIGQGWTGDETLGVAVFCALHFGNQYRDGVLAAVNFSGDRDSCASVTGNIIGAAFGHTVIPEHWKRDVEMSGTISTLANDLCCLTAGIR